MHAHRTQATLGWSPQRTPVHAKPSAPQQRIVVVIPAHNERERLPGCLQSLTVAAGRVAIPVHVVVVLDACTDGTGEVVPASVHTVTISARNVGAARAAGFAALASGAGAETWLASTDADTHVPPGWLINHDDHHRTGAEAVVGTVAVHWHEHSGATRRRYERRYRTPETAAHGHVHGANLGVRADRYWEIGGFRPLPLGEDVDLVGRLATVGAQMVWETSQPVLTSDRRQSRARRIRRLPQRTVAPSHRQR
jgi:glycosyltransferase involved in cell wall biosynthesis